MNMKLKIAITLIGLTSVAAKLKWESYIRDLQGRFPDIPNKIIRKAYRGELINASLFNKYGDLENLTDEQMDDIFLEEVRQLTTPSK